MENDNKPLSESSEELKKDETNPVPQNSSPEDPDDGTAEKVLTALATISIIVGLLVSVIYGLMIGDHNFGAGWAVFLGGAFSSVVTWAVLKVFANIANNIRQIRILAQKNLK